MAAAPPAKNGNRGKRTRPGSSGNLFIVPKIRAAASASPDLRENAVDHHTARPALFTGASYPNRVPADLAGAPDIIGAKKGPRYHNHKFQGSAVGQSSIAFHNFLKTTSASLKITDVRRSCLVSKHREPNPVLVVALPHSEALQQLSRPHRSEERRVGKECRSRWSPYH